MVVDKVFFVLKDIAKSNFFSPGLYVHEGELLRFSIFFRWLSLLPPLSRCHKFYTTSHIIFNISLAVPVPYRPNFTDYYLFDNLNLKQSFKWLIPNAFLSKDVSRTYLSHLPLTLTLNFRIFNNNNSFPRNEINF